MTFNTPLDLPPDHYFFVPQVELTGAGEEFYWLSAPKPIVPPGTPFLPDLQSWIRNGNLDPDWLRIGTDIVGGSPVTAFNSSFSLGGTVGNVPDAASTACLLGVILSVIASLGRRRLVRR